jgi:hypothetical protein
MVTAQNDVSCGTGCTGSGPADGFDCVLASPGIPASPIVTGFGYAPKNFTPGSYSPPSGATTINCDTAYDSTAHAFTGWCSGQTPPKIMSDVAQSGGPAMDLLIFAGLTVASGSTMTLTGGNAIVFAVYGDATVSGTIHADGGAGTSGSTSLGASGPGGNYSCGSHAGQSSGDSYDDGGGGGGASASGGAGGAGVNGNSGAAGAQRANATLSPLFGGCPGGNSGSWACTTSGGGGGGALQISAAGKLVVNGTISANGGAGGTSTCHKTQNLCGGTDYPGGGGGGGSGGAMLLEGESVVTAGGTLSVDGGRGGNPQGGSGTGGSGGTASSTAGAAGTGSAGPCGSASEAAGGGGGGYGYLATNSNEPGPTYSCPTSLTPAPSPSPGDTACLCAADAGCSTHKCVNINGQCTGTCTGSGAADSTDCQILKSATTGYACSRGNCSNVTSPTGTCMGSGVACWCTSDAQCANGKCVSWAGCPAGACTGSGTADGFNCAP